MEVEICREFKNFIPAQIDEGETEPYDKFLKQIQISRSFKYEKNF